MSNIDKQQIRADIAIRKSMPGFSVSPDHSLARLKAIQETQRSFGLEVVEALLDELERKEEQRANWFQMAQKLGSDLDAAEKRIAELEAVKFKLSDPKLLSLAKDIVENLVDTGSSDQEYTQQYVDWTFKRIRAAVGKGE
ncbi:ead/Ea22-like family protein [Enterobacter cloacae]|uniref:hypothetical protein n=1 Tax=Enterobacter cloacae TaxID=550 RepID=UPI002A836881|nr:hypothetical protein [Enterobacter cloacae]